MSDRLLSLLEASRALITETSLERVLQRVVDIAVDVLDARYAALGVLAPDGRTLETFITSGMDEATRRRIGDLPRGHGILGLVIRESRTIRLPDLGRHPDSYGFPPGHPPMHSFLGVPVHGHESVFGNLYVTEKTTGPAFTDEDEQIAQMLAAHAAAAVQNARLHQDTRDLLDEVQQLMRGRERFFAMVNHELRNALTAVHGWSEMAVRVPPAVEAREALGEVLEASEEAMTLVNDLLDLARLEENRLRVTSHSVDPGELVRRAAARVRPLADAAGVTLAVQLEPDVRPIGTDARRVEQILHNLLVNAIRHAPEGTTVSVIVDRAPPHLRFAVLDHGSGVAAIDVERIFDVYETRREDGPSAGLGLAVSRRLATLLGGSLFAVHQSDGGGRFELLLPLQPGE